MQNEKRNPTDMFPPVTLAAWHDQVSKDLKGSDPGRLNSRTLDGFTIKALYTEEDLSGSGDFFGLPGFPPYRRGTHALGQFGARWQARQRYRHPDPQRVSQDVAEDLARGVSGIWLHLDRSARLGDGQALGDGMLCPDLTTFMTALSAVDLSRHPLSIEAGANALPAAAQWFALAQQQGVPLPKLSGALNCDPLAALAQDGNLPYSLAQAKEHMCALSHFCVDRAPNVRAVSVSTVPYHRAGASPAQEIGFALATGLHYLRTLVEAGLSVDSAASQVQFTVAVGSDFFMEIAKLRALRQAWAFVAGKCGCNEETQRLVVQAMTSPFSKTRFDPYVNMLRSTTEVFAAAVGGADAICSAGFDTAYGPEEGFSRRIASNAQVVLNEESHVARVSDPAGGSYFVESITDELSRAGYSVFQAIERAGGQEAALLSGHVHELIQEKAEMRRRDLRRRKQALTGVSEFANLSETPLTRPVAEVGIVAQRLHMTEPANHLPTIDQHNQGADLVVAVMAATTAGAPIRGITAVLRGQDAPAECSPLPQHTAAGEFEALRDRSAAHADQTGSRPTAFLCNLGSIPEHKARATFAAGFLQSGGIACLDNDGFADIMGAVAAYRAANTSIAVLCGSDAQYAEWVPNLVPELRAAGAQYIVVAGKPGETEQQQRDAGVTDYIFMGADVVGTIEDLFARLGVA